LIAPTLPPVMSKPAKFHVLHLPVTEYIEKSKINQKKQTNKCGDKTGQKTYPVQLLVEPQLTSSLFALLATEIVLEPVKVTP
jgi:hypothetical protein